MVAAAEVSTQFSIEFIVLSGILFLMVIYIIKNYWLNNIQNLDAQKNTEEIHSQPTKTDKIVIKVPIEKINEICEDSAEEEIPS